ncbi:putative RNA-directed DNA polymerase [Tanacetum coccineum]
MWGEAILSANFLLNKIPHKEKEETPYELWMGRKPSYKYLRVWGYLAKVEIPAPKAQKIGPNTVDSVFIGRMKAHLDEMMWLSKKRDNEMMMSFMMRDIINLRKKMLNLEEAKRARIKKSFLPNFVSFMIESEPNTYREAVTSSEGPQSKEAIRSEIDSSLQNYTWEVMDLPPGCKPLGYKRIFKKKKKVDGTIDKYKARLAIKGFRNKKF